MNRAILFSVVISLFAGGSVAAQEESNSRRAEGGIFSSREEYDDFMGKLRGLNDPEINKLIPAINDVIMSSHGLKKQAFGSPFHSERSWMMRLLENRGVREEIEVLDYQYEDLKESSRTIHEKMTKQIRDVLRQQASGDFDADELLDQLSGIRERAESELDRTLLPSQHKRLRQILMHGRLLREPLIKVLTSEPVADELGLSSGQKEMLQEEWQQIERKLNSDIAKLRSRARKELAAKLPAEQRQKYHQLFGNEFQFKPNPKKDDAGKEQ